MLQQRHRLSVLQNETEKSNMNMTSIHCKLQEEAEKIRKWQTTSEIELKQKIAKLKECEILITKQRNQVLEKQIENENLIAQLEKEQMNQAQINLKLKTARELFIALKNHSENLQSSIIRGEEDRDSLRMLAADNIKQIQELKTKMQEVVETTEKRLGILKATVKDKDLAYEQLKTSSKNEIDSAKNANIALEKEVSNCKANIDDISRQLLDKRGCISSLEDKIRTLEGEKTDQVAIMDSQNSKLDNLQKLMSETKSAFKSAQDHCEELMQEKQILADELKSYKIDAERQIEELQTELSELTDSLTQLSTQYNEINSKHDRIESENKTLKESVSQLVKCVEELQEKQESYEAEVKTLTDACSSAKKSEDKLNALIENKDAKLQELSLLRDECQVQLDSTSQNLNDIKLREVDNLQKIEILTQSNRAKDEQLAELVEKSLKSDNNSKTISSDLNKKSLEYDALDIKCKQFEQNCNSLSITLSAKESELIDLVNENKTLKQQVNDFLGKLDQLKEDHCHISIAVTVMQESLESCNSEMASLKDTIRCQEDVLARKDAVASKLKCQIQSSTAKISDLSKNVAQLEQKIIDISFEKEKTEELLKDKEESCSSYEHKNVQLQSRINQLLEESENSKLLLNSAFSDSSDLQKRLSEQLDCATANLSDKDKQIEKLLSDVALVKLEMSKELNRVLAEKQTSDKKTVELKDLISKKDGDISALGDELNKLSNKIAKLEDVSKTVDSDTNEKLNSMNSTILSLEQHKKDLIQKMAEYREEKEANDFALSELNNVLAEKDKQISELQLNQQQLQSENSRFCDQVKDLNSEINMLKSHQSNLKATNQKLKEKESQLNALSKSMNKLKKDHSDAESGYLSTIEKLKNEIKKLNKSKVEAVLSNVSSKSPALHESLMTSPVKQPKQVHPESPKTPTVSRSKKRRVAFGKSPSWHSASDDEIGAEEEADMTVSSSTSADPKKVKYLNVNKSPKTVTYASAKSPSRLKLSNAKSPGRVSDILAKYPTPSSTHKRGVKLPDAYLKRKEANEKKKNKIKVEARSWFDSDSAFGFDEC